MSRKKVAHTAVILPAIAFVIMIVASSAWGQTVQEVVASVEKHYSEVTTITSRVVQKNFLKAVGRTQSFDGMLWIKKPGKLRLDFTNDQVILVDGKSALLYSKKSEQMIRKNFGDAREMNIPVAFLLGAARIRDDFDVLQPDPKSPRLLELLPKRQNAAMKKLGLRADNAGRITELSIIDRSGNTTDIFFSDINEGVGFDDKVFKFTPPQGTEIIEQ